jgi:adenylosuccinate lyase
MISIVVVVVVVVTQVNVELTGERREHERTLGLVAEGLTREEAYAAVQRNAMTAWDTGQQLQDLLAKDEDVVGKIDPSRLDAMFDPSHHLRHLDEVFERVEAL